MRLNKYEGTKKSIIWGFINILIKSLCPFIIRTIIIYKLGENYVGLNSLFVSILNVLSLAELGFDVAVVSVMYSYVAKDDNKKIYALLLYFKKIYYIVGSIILVAGASCIPFLKFMIKDYDSLPSDINVIILFSIYLLNTVITYFFGGYRNSIFNIYQRRDVLSNINTFIVVISTICQVLILLLTANYYIYLATLPLFSLLTNLLIVYFSKKLFPEIKTEGKLEKEDIKSLNKTISGTFLARVGGVLSVSFDSIVISSMLGVVLLAHYSNYTYIITTITSFVSVITISMQAAFGNSVNLDSVEKNYEMLRKFTFLFCWIVGVTSLCLLYLLTPFMRIWVGSEGVLPFVIVIALVVKYYVSLHDSILGTYKAALSIWWEDRFRCLIGGIVNLGLNIGLAFLLKYSFGEVYAILGIVIATIIQQVVILTPWATNVTFDLYFKTGKKRYYLDLLIYFCVTVAIGAALYPLFNMIPEYDKFDGIPYLILRLGLCLIVPNILYLLVYFKTHNFKLSKEFVIAKLRRH